MILFVFPLVPLHLVELLNEVLGLIDSLGGHILQLDVELEREKSVLNQREGEDGHDLQEADKCHIVWRGIAR